MWRKMVRVPGLAAVVAVRAAGLAARQSPKTNRTNAYISSNVFSAGHCKTSTPVLPATFVTLSGNHHRLNSTNLYT